MPIATLVVVLLLSYSNSLSVQLIGDDVQVIFNSPIMKRLESFGLFQEASGQSIALSQYNYWLRPVTDATFALNYVLGGRHIWSYQLFNVLLHVLNTLCVFGIVRQTLTSPPLTERWGASAWQLALVVALYWGAHPLQTQAVNDLAQRSELLAGFFYLALIYCLAKSQYSARAGLWLCAGVVATCLGMGSQASMATAPVLALMYDRTFMAGRLTAALKQRRWFYTGLVFSWMCLTLLLQNDHPAAFIAELGDGRSDVWLYVATQPSVILHYLRLSLWPSPLLFDYQWPIATTWQVALLPTAIVLALLSLTCWGWVRNCRWGFVCAGFFVVLAPSSILMPRMDQYANECRMYLAVLAPVVLIVMGTCLSVQAVIRHGNLMATETKRLRTVLLFACIVALVGLATSAHERNYDYRDGLTLWRDTVLKSPNNPRALVNLGATLLAAGQIEESIKYLNEAIEIAPDNYKTHIYLAHAFDRRSEFDDAIREYQQAISIQPRSALAYLQLGNVYLRADRRPEAISQYRTVLWLQPGNTYARTQLELAVTDGNQLATAANEYHKIPSIDPKNALAHTRYGRALMKEGKCAQAIGYFRESIALDANSFETHVNLGDCLVLLGQATEAAESYQRGLKLAPNHLGSRLNLARVFYNQNRDNAALLEFNKALAINPKAPEVHLSLGYLFIKVGRTNDAIESFQRCTVLDSTNVECHMVLGKLYFNLQSYDLAVQNFSRVVALEPNNADGYAKVGQTFMRLDAISEALPALEMATELDPMNEEYLFSYSVALLENGQHELAIAFLNKALEVNSSNVTTLNYLGVALAQTKQFEAATEIFKQTLSIEPDNLEAKKNMLMALTDRSSELYALGERALAIEKITEVLSINPSDAGARNRLTRWLRK